MSKKTVSSIITLIDVEYRKDYLMELISVFFVFFNKYFVNISNSGNNPITKWMNYDIFMVSVPNTIKKWFRLI